MGEVRLDFRDSFSNFDIVRTLETMLTTLLGIRERIGLRLVLHFF